MKKAVKSLLIGCTLILTSACTQYAVAEKVDEPQKLDAVSLPVFGEELPDIELSLASTTKAMPEKSKVYKVKEVKPSEAQIKEKANKLGITETKVMETPNQKRLMITDGKNYFEHSKENGQFMYFKDIPSENGNLLSDEEAIKKAKMYLKEFGLDKQDLMFEGLTYRSRTQNNKSYNYAQLIYFNQVLNGQKIIGNARVIISLGDNGELIGFSNNYKDYEVLADYPLKNKEKAFEEIKTQGTLDIDIEKTTKSKSVNFKNVNIAYWADRDGSFIYPVFFFEGKTDDNVTVNALAPAIDDKYINTVSADELNPQVKAGIVTDPAQK